MGSLVDTGLGWYLDEDYLRTLGSVTLGTVESSGGGGGGGGGGEPLSPNTQYTDSDTGSINVANTGDLRLNISFSNVNSRVYWTWLWIDGGSVWPGQTVWCIAAISDQPFSMWMEGWGTQNASKPPSYYNTYLSLLSGMSEWNDVYGIAMGWHLSYPQSASYNYDPNYNWSSIAQDFHDSVTGRPSNVNELADDSEDLRPITAVPFNMGYSGVNLTQLSPIGDNAWAFWGRVNNEFWSPCVITVGTITAINGTGINGFVRNFRVSGDYRLHTWYSDSAHNALPAGWPSIVSTSWDRIFQIAIDRVSVITKTITKVQGGTGAFAIVSYPHDDKTVHVGVGISSIPNPNSAATVAVDGTNGSYNTFNREGMQFTMFYTEQLIGTLTAYVPVVNLNTDISALPGLYEARLFLATADAAQIHVGFVPEGEDPYGGGGTSEPGGGGGSFDDTSDQIGDSTTPTFSFASSGFCRIYNPNLSQLQSLANYLWTDTNFLQTVINHAKQLLEDPIEAIISLAMLPVAIPQGTAETVKVLFISTQVSMPPATTQYVEVDCGTYTLEEYYGSALDYNPYTQVDLFLPFIGQVSLNTDEVMGHTIGVKYRVDIVSGLCVAKVFVDGDCMYQFSGNCAIFMPLNSADFSSYLSAAMTAATALVSAGAGVAAGAAATGAEAVAEPAVQTGGNLLTAGESLVTPQMALQYRVEESVRPMYSSGGEGSPSGSLGEMERKFINNSAAAVMGSKINFEHASHLAGNSGILGVRRPYLIINRPDMCNPEKYGKYNGRPCMMYLYLGNLTGYTEIQEIQLTGFSATNPELSEISKMLKGGVIF